MTIRQLEECIDVHGKDIYGFCRQITGSAQEGEDLYQDTFMKAVEHLDKMDMERNPKGYLLSVALGLWKNRRRKYAWRQRIAGMDSLEEKAENGDLISDTCVRTPEEDFLMNEKKKAVQECIAQLPEAYRIPMVLYYSAELSLKETAEILKLSEGTVKSRLYKARKIIKGKLEANGYDR